MPQDALPVRVTVGRLGRKHPLPRHRPPVKTKLREETRLSSRATAKGLVITVRSSTLSAFEKSGRYQFAVDPRHGGLPALLFHHWSVPVKEFA